MTADSRVPVTVLTGYLGAGKTTLLNRILKENHGKKIAVIENEFGEVGVDQELVIGAQEEIFEMNNGCICCTVRGDLIRILGNLMKRRDKFDYILIETTGLADPGPVAQTFFVDSEMRAQMRLDGIVTVVDAKHVVRHFDDKSGEAREQIAFADVILLNKTDLVPGDELDRLEARIAAMNRAARLYRTLNADIEIPKILDVGGFNLARALEVDPGFLVPELPFEWAGAYELPAGTHTLALGAGNDPSMDVVLLPLPGAGDTGLRSVERDVVLAFSDEPVETRPGEAVPPGKTLRRLKLKRNGAAFALRIPEAGSYGIFTEHQASKEYALEIRGPSGALVPVFEWQPAPDHVHDEEVASVGITMPGDLDEKKVNAWLGTLLREKGADIFRMKGILSIKGKPERFVFQGVHMLVDGRPDRPWNGERRRNSIIFIGRHLDRAALNKEFKACLS